MATYSLTTSYKLLFVILGLICFLNCSGTTATGAGATVQRGEFNNEIQKDGTEMDWSFDCGSDANVTSFQLTSCYSETNCTLVADDSAFRHFISVEYYPHNYHPLPEISVTVHETGGSGYVELALGVMEEIFPGKLTQGGAPLLILESDFQGIKEYKIKFRISSPSVGTEVCKEFTVTIVG